MSEPAGVLVEDQDGVRVITLNRPEVRNALDLPTATLLAEAVAGLDTTPGISIGVLTGAGGHFSAGMDLKAFARTGQRPEVPGRGLGFTRTPPRTPLIAAVEGAALAGGFEIVLACDLVVAARDATFGLPEATRGLVAGAGGLLRLPSRIPRAVAMEYALTGRRMPATQARDWGLVNQLTEPGEALAGARSLAAEIAANAPLALRVTKELINRRDDPTPADVARQDELLEQVAGSADAHEGATAFTEKRRPVWSSSS